MQHRSWPTVGLLCIIAMLLGILLVPRDVPLAHAESSEGRAEGIIALTAAVDRDSLLYIVDTNREVILVYGFHVPGSRTSAGRVRTGVFEFLAARLYRWDALLAAKHEYSMKGMKALQGLRVDGPGGARTLVEKDGRPAAR